MNAGERTMIYRGYEVQTNATDSGIYRRVFKDGIRVHTMPLDSSEEETMAWIDAEKKKALDSR
jgi:hypothetical protein